MAFGIDSRWPLALLPIVPLAGWLAWRSRGTRPGRRWFVVTTLRALAVVCVLAALAGPTWQHRSDAVSVMYALDISHSIAPGAVRAAMDWIRETNARYRPAHAGYVVFSDRAQLVGRIEDIEAVPVGVAHEDARDALDRGTTDLERGVGAALTGFRPGHSRRLVLITDGKQTRGDVWRQLPALQGARVRVFTVPAPTGFPGGAWIDAVDLPEGVRARAPIPARLRLGATSATHGRIEIRVDDQPRFVRAVALAPGTNTVAVDLRFPHVGESRITTVLVTPDGRTDTLHSSVWVRPPVRLLHVDGGRIGTHPLADALSANGIDVRSVSVARWAADPTGALRDMDAVLLSDVNARALGDAPAHALLRFVRDEGGGLIFVAGENAYGHDGLSGSMLERMLPVRFEARRNRDDFDLVLLIDRSYSMRGDRLELAKTAALATLDLLEPRHRLAVVAFDSRPHDVVPLARVGSRRRAEDAIGTMAAGGRTDVHRALRHAFELLKDSESRTRHVILLTDGETVPPPNARGAAKPESAIQRTLEDLLRSQGQSVERTRELLGADAAERTPAAGGFEDVVADMVRVGITLSTVAIGETPNLPLLTSLAAQGGGRSYVARRDGEIPGLFVTEARRLLGDAMVESPFRPVVAGGGAVLAGIDFATGPELRGFVTTRPKRFADVLLEASDKAPLLAQTRYGLGKTVAFLSDANNRWAQDWLTWPGFGRFWSQVVRDAARPAAGQGLTLGVRRREGTGFIELTALDPEGGFRDALWPKVRMRRPDGGSAVITLRQSAPGTYVASVPLRPGAHAPFRFELLPGQGLSPAETANLGVRSLYYPNRDEFRPRPPDFTLLAALSERTGGGFAPAPAAIFAPATDGEALEIALWPWLAAAALLLLLIEIAARRVPWPALDALPRH